MKSLGLITLTVMGLIVGLALVCHCCGFGEYLDSVCEICQRLGSV